MKQPFNADHATASPYIRAGSNAETTTYMAASELWEKWTTIERGSQSSLGLRTMDGLL
jgi:hypothetical protein